MHSTPYCYQSIQYKKPFCKRREYSRTNPNFTTQNSRTILKFPGLPDCVWTLKALYIIPSKNIKVYYLCNIFGKIIIPRKQSLCWFLTLVSIKVKGCSGINRIAVDFKWFILDILSGGELINLLEFNNRITMSYHSN